MEEENLQIHIKNLSASWLLTTKDSKLKWHRKNKFVQKFKLILEDMDVSKLSYLILVLS